MGAFFVYILKAAVCLAAFYLFYKLLLSRETFHRFNRFALLGIVAVSFIVPCVELTAHYSTEISRSFTSLERFMEYSSVDVEAAAAAVPAFRRQGLILSVYVLGALFFAVRQGWSMHRMYRLLHRGACVRGEDGVKILVYEGEIAPFSWMNYMVVSRRDYEEHAPAILAHEKAHIRKKHSYDILLVDICMILQWFNPAIWLLKRELQNIHEYEADEAVLKRGIDAKNYQLLLIKKAVGTRLYSMANSFNHSSLKKRITMMRKKRSNAWARLKYVYVLPLAAIAVAAFARPEVSSGLNEISSSKVMELSEFVQTESAKIVEAKKDTDVVFQVVEEMPEFPGGMEELFKFMSTNLKYPVSAQKARKQGRVVIQCTVEKDGSLSEVKVVRSVDPDLDAEAVRVVSAMPKWKPGRQRGQVVRVKYALPVIFKL